MCFFVMFYVFFYFMVENGALGTLLQQKCMLCLFHSVLSIVYPATTLVDEDDARLLKKE